MDHADPNSIQQSVREIVCHAGKTRNYKSVRQQLLVKGFDEARAKVLVSSLQALLEKRRDIDEFYCMIMEGGIPADVAQFVMFGVTRALGDLGFRPGSASAGEKLTSEPVLMFNGENPQAPDPSNPAREPVTLHPRISELKERFNRNGFRINDASNTPEFPFHYSASKVRFDLVGVPTFLEEFFIFQGFEEVTMPRFHEFIDQAWEWALVNENPMPESAELSKSALKCVTQFLTGMRSLASIQLDNMSVRQTTCLVYVYAIAVSGRVGSDVLEWIWSKKSAAARKHTGQGNLVVPVIYKTSTRMFHHFRKRPILGNVYYTEARKVMKKHLIE